MSNHEMPERTSSLFHRRARRPNAAFCLIAALALSAVVACSGDDDESMTANMLEPNGSGTSDGTSSDNGSGSSTGPGATTTSGPGTGTTGNVVGGGTSAGSSGTSTSGGTAAGGAGAGGASAGPGANGTAGGAAAADAAGMAADASVIDVGSTPEELAAAVASLEDGQLVFLADTLNAGEVDQARAALPRLSDAAVVEFAEEMIEDHGPARDALLSLSREQDIAPQLSDVAAAVKDQGEQVVIALIQTEDDDDVDVTYIDSQVVAHTTALSVIDASITAADAPPLQEQLTTLRASIEEHLSTATELQERLRQNPADAAAATGSE